MNNHVYFIYLPNFNSYVYITFKYEDAVEAFQKHDGQPHKLSNGNLCYPRVELLRYTRDHYTGALGDMTMLAMGERRPVLIYE